MDQCVYYLSEYGTPQMLLKFWLRHGKLEEVRICAQCWVCVCVCVVVWICMYVYVRCPSVRVCECVSLAPLILGMR